MANCFCSGPDHTGKCACQRGSDLFKKLEEKLEDTTESLSIHKPPSRRKKKPVEMQGL